MVTSNEVSSYVTAKAFVKHIMERAVAKVFVEKIVRRAEAIVNSNGIARWSTGTELVDVTIPDRDSETNSDHVEIVCHKGSLNSLKGTIRATRAEDHSTNGSVKSLLSCKKNETGTEKMIQDISICSEQKSFYSQQINMANCANGISESNHTSTGKGEFRQRLPEWQNLTQSNRITTSRTCKENKKTKKNQTLSSKKRNKEKVKISKQQNSVEKTDLKDNRLGYRILDKHANKFCESSQKLDNSASNSCTLLSKKSKRNTVIKGKSDFTGPQSDFERGYWSAKGNCYPLSSEMLKRSSFKNPSEIASDYEVIVEISRHLKSRAKCTLDNKVSPKHSLDLMSSDGAIKKQQCTSTGLLKGEIKNHPHCVSLLNTRKGTESKNHLQKNSTCDVNKSGVITTITGAIRCTNDMRMDAGVSTSTARFQCMSDPYRQRKPSAPLKTTETSKKLPVPGSGNSSGIVMSPEILKSKKNDTTVKKVTKTCRQAASNSDCQVSEKVSTSHQNNSAGITYTWANKTGYPLQKKQEASSSKEQKTQRVCSQIYKLASFSRKPDSMSGNDVTTSILKTRTSNKLPMLLATSRQGVYSEKDGFSCWSKEDCQSIRQSRTSDSRLSESLSEDSGYETVPQLLSRKPKQVNIKRRYPRASFQHTKKPMSKIEEERKRVNRYQVLNEEKRKKITARDIKRRSKSLWYVKNSDRGNTARRRTVHLMIEETGSTTF